MKIEVGEYYLRADKNIIHIVEEKKDAEFAFMDSDFTLYTKNGNHFLDETNCENDLIAHIPKQLLNYIVFVTELYHTNNDMKQMVDNNYGDKK